MNNQSSFDKTLQRRRNIAVTLETAIRESPTEMTELLSTIGKIYESGRIPRFWDVLAGLAGADRGYGNDWFFTALELLRQKNEEQSER
jgi:hypothetical protein